MGIINETLQGGYINTVQRMDSSISKKYSDGLMTASNARLRREYLALKHFARTDVPVPLVLNFNNQDATLIMGDLGSHPLLDDYVKGASIEDRSRILTDAGKVLRKIHSPVCVNPQYYINKFISKTNNALDQSAEVLDYEGVNRPELNRLIETVVDKDHLMSLGVSRVHRDFWLNNVLHNGEGVIGVIDWEYAGLGFPYEDFASVNLWIERVHGNAAAFWKGYGSLPQKQTLDGFVIAECLYMLAGVNYRTFMAEKKHGGGILVNTLNIIREIQEIYAHRT